MSLNLGSDTNLSMAMGKEKWNMHYYSIFIKLLKRLLAPGYLLVLERYLAYDWASVIRNVKCVLAQSSSGDLQVL